MKKLFLLKIIILGIIGLSLMFTACDKDSGTDPDEELTGTWNLTSILADFGLGEVTLTIDFFGYDYIRVTIVEDDTIDEDGTFDAVAKPTGLDEVTGSGTWDVDGDEITLVLDEGNPISDLLGGIETLTAEFNISGDNLTIETTINYELTPGSDPIPVDAVLTFTKQ